MVVWGSGNENLPYGDPGTFPGGLSAKESHIRPPTKRTATPEDASSNQPNVAGNEPNKNVGAGREHPSQLGLSNHLPVHLLTTLSPLQPEGDTLAEPHTQIESALRLMTRELRNKEAQVLTPRPTLSHPSGK